MGAQNPLNIECSKINQHRRPVLRSLGERWKPIPPLMPCPLCLLSFRKHRRIVWISYTGKRHRTANLIPTRKLILNYCYRDFIRVPLIFFSIIWFFAFGIHKNTPSTKSNRNQIVSFHLKFLTGINDCRQTLTWK